MDNIIIDTFRPEHLALYRPRESERFAPQMYEQIVQMALNSANLVLIDREKDELIAAAGLFVPWPGVAEAWTLTSALIAKHARACIRIYRNALFSAREQLKLRRIQCLVSSQYPEHAKFAKCFGFVQEGSPMVQFGPNGEDFYRFAWVKKCPS